MEIQFIVGVGLISHGTNDTRSFLTDVIGLPLKGHEVDADYAYSEHIEGVKHFSVWPLAQAAEACFGTTTWPAHLPLPQVTIELEVKDEAAVAAIEAELRAKGHALLHATRKEPWGQSVCRLLTKEGVILGISFAPWHHKSTI